MPAKLPHCCRFHRSDAEEVFCQRHGAQITAVVCQHLVQSVDDGRPRGFHIDGSGGPAGFPDAWCSECDSRVFEDGGEWTDAVMSFLHVGPVCVECYASVRAVNSSVRIHR
jgi:hypothetical protein